jgi:hypothetical protein
MQAEYSKNISFNGYGYSKVRQNAMNVFRQINKTLEIKDKISFDELTQIAQKETNDKSVLVFPFNIFKKMYPGLFAGKLKTSCLSLPAYEKSEKNLIFVDEIRKGDTKGISTFVHAFSLIVQSLKRKDKALKQTLKLGKPPARFQEEFFSGVNDIFAPLKGYTTTFIDKWLKENNVEKSRQNDYIKRLMEFATKEKEAYRLESEIYKISGNNQMAKLYSTVSKTYRLMVLELKKHLT